MKSLYYRLYTQGSENIMEEDVERFFRSISGGWIWVSNILGIQQSSHAYDFTEFDLGELGEGLNMTKINCIEFLVN